MKPFNQLLSVFFLLSLLLYSFSGACQTRPTVQVLTPPPPDVSALGKFGLIPVSNFTGIPDISYPIYTVKEGTLSFPISLKYYAGGLKVKEDASEVGLGWALSASGTITSTTRGAPDFPGGFQNSYFDMPDAPDVVKTFKSPRSSIEGYYYLWTSEGHQFSAYNGSSGGTIYSGLSLPHNGVSKEYFNYFQVGYDGRGPDFTSDLYHINIGEKSYKFIFDNNFKPVVLGDGSLNIELIPNGAYPDWKVTDENGVAYFFTQRQLYYSNSSDPYFVGNRTSSTMNTWYLKRIVSPINGEIDFNYAYNTQQFVHPLPTLSETYLVGNVSPHTQQATESVVPNFTIYQQLNLSSITFSEGEVKFLYADQRLDLDGAKRLQSIEVRNKQNKLVKKVMLDNDAYFTATAGFSGIPEFNGIFNNLSQFTNENHYKRLKLKGVIESDSTGTNQYKKTSYTYNEQLNLPVKLSLAIDHWGYYNGAGNSQLIPPAKIMFNGSQQILAGANRNANRDYMQANMLTGITYPTGGSSAFTYETNQYQQQDLVTTYYDSVGDGYKASGSSTMNYSSLLNSTGSFTAGAWGDKRLGIFCLVDRHGTYPSNYDLNIAIYKDGSFLKRITTSASSYTPVVDSSIVINAGSVYKFVFEPFTQDFYNNCEIRFQVSVKATSSSTSTVLNTYYSGGLRVSKIASYDPASQTTNVKKYTYLNGVPDDVPIYVSQEGTDFYQEFPSTGVIDRRNVFRYRYGQSVYPFSDGRDAAFFGYGKVQVSESDQNNQNGMTEFTYNSTNSLNVNTMLYYSNVMTNSLADAAMSSASIINPVLPVIPAISNGRGDLIQEKHYKAAGNNLTPVSMDYYYYDRDNPSKVWQMLFNSGLSDYTSPGFDNGQLFLIYAHQFAIPVYRNVLQRKEHFEYDEAGNPTLSTFENFTYDKSNGHYQLIKKSIGTSRGDTLNTYFKYPQDYPDLQTVTSLDSAAMGIKKLQITHTIIPVETFTERVVMSTPITKQYLGGLLNIFNPEMPTLKRVSALETATPLSSFSFSSVSGGSFSKNAGYADRLGFRYDNIGRPLQQYMVRGSTMSYIWGASLAFPMAQVNNAGQDVVAYTSLETDGDGGWSVPSSNRVSGGVTGRQSYNLSSGAVTKSGLASANKYVVSYYSKSAGPLTISGTISGYPLNGPAVNGWYYHEHQITGVSSVTVGGTGTVDEIRLYPVGSQMTTYFYDSLIGLKSVTDSKGLTTYYEYDDFQRLKNVKDKDGNIVKHVDYHYQGQ